MGYIIYLFGPSASGKSTTADLLQDSISTLDVIDFDIIKRQIPHYDWSQHAHNGKVMTLDKLKLDSITEDKILLLFPTAKSKDEYEMVNSIATNTHRKLINIQITAPNEVLIERYENRLANIDPLKKDWKFKTLDEFTTKLTEPYYIPPDTYLFDSSNTSPQDIVDGIIKLTL